MTICGYCKANGLKLVKTRNEENGGYETVLQPHTVRGTHSTECKGLETYLNLGPDGLKDRNRK